MKYKTIPCPFCKTGHAHITYEENRVYQLNCPDCSSAIFRKDKSWDAAVEFFERMMISDGWIPVTERLPEHETRVLILTTVRGWNGKKYQKIMCGFYEDGNIYCEDSKVCWDCEMKREENYDESRDDYRVPEGWFEELLNHIDDYNCVQIGDTATHWMPMPDAPKEGE